MMHIEHGSALIVQSKRQGLCFSSLGEIGNSSLLLALPPRILTDEEEEETGIKSIWLCVYSHMYICTCPHTLFLYLQCQRGKDLIITVSANGLYLLAITL